MFYKAKRRSHIFDVDLKYPGLETQSLQRESRSRMFQYFRKFLRGQFGRPMGFCGYIVGMIMAHTPSNMDRIRWTISLLEIKPDDRILEIGFGTGYAIHLVNKIATKGLVAGVDHSEVMVRHASKQNAKAICEGKVLLRLGSASNPPKFHESFDKIYTINSIHFWNDPVDCLKELRDMLKPGGLIAVTIQPRSRSDTDATTNAIGKEVAMNLESAGFSQVRLEIRKTKPVSVACALGIRS